MSRLNTSRRGVAVVDLDAISANVAGLGRHVGERDVMAVVKADGYGHGIRRTARAQRVAGGLAWLGVALLEEALTLRAAGDQRTDLVVVGPFRVSAMSTGIVADVELSAYCGAQLDDIAAAGGSGRHAGQWVQLKLDSGLGRGGAHPDDWPVSRRGRSRCIIRGGLIQVTGSLVAPGLLGRA